MELKVRVGAPATSATYKKHVKTFEEGSPQDWIRLLKDLDEIWNQNSVNGPSDKTATIRSLVKGESLTAFEAALEEARANPDNPEEPLPITVEHVNSALGTVTTEVFPHRALEMQKMWMQRGMKKPYNLSIRKTAAAITKMNNDLLHFPGATQESKFSQQQVIKLIEWSLTAAWRAKFDWEGYLPTLHDKKRLIEAGKAIERNEENKR